MSFKKILSPKSNHHNYTTENHAALPSTLNSRLYQLIYRSRGFEKLREFNELLPYFYSKNQGTAEPL